MNSASLAPSCSSPWKLFSCYCALTLLLVFPSTLLWSTVPFDVLRHNFDWFCGLLHPAGWTHSDVMLLGRFVQAILFAASGLCFYRLATRYASAIEAASPRTLVIGVGTLLVIHFAALPWLNPDLFFAIGRGWVDAHYLQEPYLVSIASIPHFRADPMFQNIDPGLFKILGNYGPIHHSIAASLAGVSGGDIRIAVVLFKLANLVCLLATAAILFRLARRTGLQAKHVTFCYLANPILPLALLAWGHNDAIQNLFLLVVIACLFVEKPLLSGVALGAAIATKYVGIVLLPALLIYWLRRKKWDPRAAALSFAGVLAVVVGTHAMYPGSWNTLVTVYTAGWSPIRSSIYSIFVPIARAIHATTFAPARAAATLAYVASGATLTFACLWRRDVKPIDFVKVCVWIFNLYFLFAAPAVLEWYLTWNFAAWLLLPGYFRSFTGLCSTYMVLVPFTLYLPDTVQYPINIGLFLLFAGWVVSSTPWWRRFARAGAPVPLIEPTASVA